MATTIYLKKFDINTMKKHSSNVIIGKRATGKSILIKDLLNNNNDIAYIPTKNVISCTEEYKKFYENIIPNSTIYYNFSDEIISNIIQTSKTNICNKNNLYSDESLIIFDDAILTSIRNNNYIQELFVNGRNYKMTIILSMSHPMDLSQLVISNTDYAFIFNNNINCSRRNLYDKYATIFPTFEIFNTVLNSLNKYECLVIDLQCNSNKIEDCVFFYKANMCQENNNKRKFQNVNDTCDKNKKIKLQKPVTFHESYNELVVKNGINGTNFSN